MAEKSLTLHRPSQNLAPADSYSFEQIQRMASSFAKSGLFGVKDTDQALSLMLYAQATGRHPALIMRDYDVIQGRLAKKAEVMLRDFQSTGGRVEWTKYADDGVTGVFSHPLSQHTLTIDWNLARAKQAGLANKEGGMYTKYPRAMFRSRCISEGVRALAPDATEHMYTPEEIRAIEVEQQPVSMTLAVTQATTESRNALPAEEVEELLKSLEVSTLTELTPAFGKAYTRAKEAQDEITKKKLKARYDEKKDEIAERVAIEAEGAAADPVGGEA